MWPIGRSIHPSRALDWHDVWDSLVQYARGINDIHRHTLKRTSVERTMLDDSVVYDFEAIRVATLSGGNPPEIRIIANTEASGEQTNSIYRFHLNLREDHLRKYLVAWRFVVGKLTETTDVVVRRRIRGFLSLNGVRVLGSEAFQMGQYNNSTLLAVGGTSLSLSSHSYAELIPGNHTLSLSIETLFPVGNSYLELSFADIRW